MKDTDVTLEPSAEVLESFKAVRAALRDNRAFLLAVPELVAMRPGYTATRPPVPAAVLAFRPPRGFVDADAIEAKLGVAVVLVEATPEEQLRGLADPGAASDMERFLRGPLPDDFRAPVRGTYIPPSGRGAPKLEVVDGEMNVVLSASPDAGWPVLRDFFAQPIHERLTVGMYQFTAPHIYEAIRDALRGGDASLAIGLHPRPEAIPEKGSKAEDVHEETLLKRLKRYLGSRLDHTWTSVGSGGAFSSAYHIKVAVADGERFWLSTGNWQSSNQPPYDPINDPENLPEAYGSSYNREYHVVCEHPGLARTFEEFLDYDRTLTDSYGPPTEVSPPDLFLPKGLEPTPDFAPRKYFPAFHKRRRFRVQPILTPDNYFEHVVALVQGAEKSLYFQNQYINLNPSGDFPEFKKLVKALLERSKKIDVRIICRNFMAQEKLDMLLALGFDREQFKFMRNCHAKLIIADSKRVLVGSHNWSNDGCVSNRDASLLFHDEEAAQYFEQFFLEDWGRANAKPTSKQPRVAKDGEESFAGGRRVEWGEIYDEPPQWNPRRNAAPKPATPVAAVAAKAASSGNQKVVSFGLGAGSSRGGSSDDGASNGDVVTFSGINGETGNYLRAPVSVATLVSRVRGMLAPARPEEKTAERKRRQESFGPPVGTDPNDLRTVGWGIVFAENTPADVRKALAPLCDRRKSQTIAPYYKELEYKKGETAKQFLERHNVMFGAVRPPQVPFHLLLVGSPEEISFEAQYLLDLEYSVGRLWFPTAGEYANYAKSVVAYENAAAPLRDRKVAYWGPKHAGDAATALSSASLITPLDQPTDLGDAIASQMGYASKVSIGQDASRARLLELLHAEQPSLLFTAGHGMGFPIKDEQRAVQGALLTQDWTGFGQIKRTDYVTATDVKDDAKVHGLVAFLFACYCAGTPRLDGFPEDSSGPVEIAKESFVAALPQRLLGHPNGGALAVLGHVDRAWGYSIKPPGLGEQIAPFRNCVGRILAGECIGNATVDFSAKSAAMGSILAEALMPWNTTTDEVELVRTWIERNDAKSYVILGDPAARIRKV
jgi:hypothetical protein